MLESKQLRIVFAWVFLLVGLIAWVVGLRPVDPAALNDLGLISVLPPTFWLAVVCTTVAFTLICSVPKLSLPAVAATLLLLSLILYGTTALTEALPRFNTTYVHLGFVDAISREQRLFPEMDARFSWPAFFAAGTMVSDLAGIDLLDLARWFPLATTLLTLPALWVLMSAFTSDWRLICGGLWFFLIGDWVGQDYFSPQGVNILLYVWFLGLAAWYLGRHQDARWLAEVRRWLNGHVPLLFPVTSRGYGSGDDPNGPAGVSTAQRTRVLSLLAAIVLASATSHQLTPFAMLGGSLAIAAVGRTRVRWLPVMVGVITITWVSLAAQSYLLGNLDSIIGQVGDAGASAQVGIAGRVRGSLGHTVVVLGRIAFSVAIWGTAGIGVLRRLREGRWDVAAVAMAGAPLALIAVQSYGGEVFLRAFLFSLPATSFLVAAALMPSGTEMSRARAALIVAFSLVVSVGFVTARYGNERADIVTQGEVDVVDDLYDAAPFGSAILTINFNSVVRYRYVEQYDHFEFAPDLVNSTSASLASALDIARAGRPGFLLMTRGQQALEELRGLRSGRWQALLTELDASPRSDVVARSADGVAYRVVPTPTGDGTPR
ncbi:MAG: hypothetical protein WKF78_05665 [Candidatus Limnocylindrales bacterium]